MNLRTFLGKNPSGQPVEVGAVAWRRDLDEAVSAATETGKPIFALFQEVPGCAGCKQFGRDVLSHPVVVDSVQDAFVPLLIHNNAPGRDAEILEAFGEPAWNYQVVRFLDANTDDIIERKDQVWETGPLVARMVESLTRVARPVPPYLRLLEQEQSDRLGLVHIAQACFWVGEMELGQIDGVVATQAAFMGGHEVTSVWFDPEEVTVGDLAAEAQRRQVASLIFAGGDELSQLQSLGVRAEPIDDVSHRIAPKSDQKRQIRGMGGLGDLSISQLTKVNGFVHRSGELAAAFLPPSQRHILGR